MIVISQPIEFEWDENNKDKNWIKHKVRNEEAEEVFFDDNKKLYFDPTHSHQEKRYIIVGKTKKKRLLFVVFTLRKNKVRVISARDLNKRKEKQLYEKTI